MNVESMNTLSIAAGTKIDIELFNKWTKSAEEDVRRVEKKIVDVEKRLLSETKEEYIVYYQKDMEFLLKEKKSLRNKKELLRKILLRSMPPTTPVVSHAKTR